MGTIHLRSNVDKQRGYLYMVDKKGKLVAINKIPKHVYCACDLWSCEYQESTNVRGKKNKGTCYAASFKHKCKHQINKQAVP